MPLERRSTQKIEIEDNGVIFVKITTTIIDTDNNDAVVGPGQHHRQPFDPAIQVVSDLPAGRARAIAQLIWTPAVVNAREAARAASNQAPSPDSPPAQE